MSMLAYLPLPLDLILEDELDHVDRHGKQNYLLQLLLDEQKALDTILDAA